LAASQHNLEKEESRESLRVAKLRAKINELSSRRGETLESGGGKEALELGRAEEKGGEKPIGWLAPENAELEWTIGKL